MKKFWQQRRESGDTLIEVLMAIAIISIVIVGAYNITNQGLRIEQNAIERTQASQTISGQAEALRTIRDLAANGNTAAKANWTTILSRTVTTAPNYATCAVSGNASPFYLDANSTTVVNTGTTISSASKYLTYWVEAQRSPSSSSYVDFHVRGCWQAVGEANRQSISTVVRLLVP